MTDWIRACSVDDIEVENLLRFDHGDRTFAVHPSFDNGLFCTDGLCTHENVHLAGGLVIDHFLECPKHNGQLDYRSSEPKGSPACEALGTYPMKAEEGEVFVLPT